MDLVERIYTVVASLPHEEKFGLQGQAKRAAVSIVLNIADGSAKSRRSIKDTLNAPLVLHSNLKQFC
jgi:four helix bundle protein